MKKRVLIVIEGAVAQAAFQNLTAGLRHEWDMAFARNSAEALNTLALAPVDAIVTEMRLGATSGLTLLAEVTQRHPRTQRFILADLNDKQSLLKCVGTSHHFIAKPCDAQTLKTTLERAFALDLWLMNEKVKKLVAQMNKLPSLPTLYFQVVKELKSPEASLENVGQIIAQDFVMTAKLLQLINSAVFGLRREVANPAEAVLYLGIETTKSLLLLAHTFSYFDQIRTEDFSVDKLWAHAMATGGLARQIAGAENAEPTTAEEIFTAGLLHDIGKLVMVANLPEQYVQAVRLADEQSRPLWEAEQEIFGASHAEVGGCLLGIWGLPVPIIEAVALHHYPSRFLSPSFSPLTAVHVANVWEHEKNASPSGTARPRVELEYLQELGLDQRLEAWREACQLPALKAA